MRYLANQVEPFLDGGWSAQGEEFRWAIDRKSRLSFRFDHGQQPCRMHLIVFPLLVPDRVERQRVLIRLPTGANPNILEMTKGEPHEFIVEFPRTEPTSGIFVVEFAFPDAVVPRELGLSDDLRRLSVAFVQLIFS